MQQFLQAFAALFFIALIFFLAWFIPRLLGKSNVMGARGRHLSVVDKVQISKDCYIVIVKMFDKVLVLGVTPGGITTLGGLSSDSLEAEQNMPEAQSFAQILKNALGMSQPSGKAQNVSGGMARRKGQEDDEKETR